VIVARNSWFDEKAEHPIIQEQVNKLQSFTNALADGMVEKKELNDQEQRLIAAMKGLEPELRDELHAKVTQVLVELTAYNIMPLLHELHAEHARVAFGRA
jgi:predicted transcriptional regulator